MDNQTKSNTSNCSAEQSEVFDFAGKVANYSNMKATELPTCQRLYPPRPATITKELHLQNLREKRRRKIEEQAGAELCQAHYKL